MDYKCLVLLLCLSGAAAQQIADFPQNPVGGMAGEPVVIVCGITGRNEKTVKWSRVDLDSSNLILIWDSTNGVHEAEYSVLSPDGGSTEYFNLQIDSAERNLAGNYICECDLARAQVAVLIFDTPVFRSTDGQLVAEVDTSFRCEVTYASPNPDPALFNLHMEDEMGSQLEEYNNTLDDNSELELKMIEYSNPMQLEYTDDGQEYACVISMPGGYEGNTTLPLDVNHKASNITLDPDDPDMIYYRTEEVTVLYSSNPYPAKQFRWYREVSPGVWELVDDEEDNDATITINNGWPDQTTLKVEIINDFDHDGDGTVTDQTANKTFAMMTLRDCCRTSDAGQLPYSVLVTTLLALLATFFLER